MKGKTNKFWIRITGWVMNLIMFGMLVNYALFTHAHVLYDGTIIAHAHPFSKSKESDQGRSHQHTALELFLLQNLQVIFFVTLLSMTLKKLVREFRKVQYAPEVYTMTSIVPLPGRAPPQS